MGSTLDHESSRALRELLDFRFRRESSLKGHSLGNLLLAALTTIGEDLELAIDEMSRLLRISGHVIPVALKRADLCAELANGNLLRGESSIDLRGQRDPRIQRVFLDPAVDCNVKAVNAIMEADLVILGPGDLYTSIIPNLLVTGIPEALASTQAIRIYVCNLMTKLGETDDFRASDFVHEMMRYLGGSNLDWVLVNAQQVPAEVRHAYLAEGALPVVSDLAAVRKQVPGVFVGRLGNNQIPLKHDHTRIAEAALRIAEMGRVPKREIHPNGHRAPATVSHQPTVAG